MQIVGIEVAAAEPGEVHTIDVWYSERRALWIVERLDGVGDQIGFATTFADEADALACVASWLRAHGEAYLVASRDPARAGRRQVVRQHRRAA